jgi:hypothetical protein
MEVNNLTSAMGTTVGWTDTMIKNISFTPYEWAKFADYVNQEVTHALYAGLILGAIAGVAGFYLAMKYMEYREEKEGKDGED